MKDNFSELKIDFVYCLFEKIFKLIIIGYKSLAEAFLEKHKMAKSRFFQEKNGNNIEKSE